jgi:uncharacterized protein (TIGR02594 family)
MKHLFIALKEFGVKEIAGKTHNLEVLKYFTETGHEWVKDDETAWCSAFANWVCKKAGLEYSGALNARSWLNIGCEIDTPEVGDVVVFWRGNPDGWQGHVAFFVRQTKDWIYVLGGNQNNQVKISAYHKNRLLGYRRLT